MSSKNPAVGNIARARTLLCILFFFSGFCALLYQTVWLRLAFAQFGVITPAISVVIAIFMLGLGLGSWIGGHYARIISKRTGKSAIILYAAAEFIIGLGAFIVPLSFELGSNFWTATGEINSWIYLLSSALVIGLAILPFATLMGTTYPIAMQYLRESGKIDQRNFGLLYAANTAGAVAGSLLTIYVLIEILGFQRTLWLAASINFLIAISALIWCNQKPAAEPDNQLLTTEITGQQNNLNYSRCILSLFLIGFCSIAMEVVWTRSFVAVLGSYVYSFATLLGVYLVSNFIGASFYCIDAQSQKAKSVNVMLILAAVFACLPMVGANPVVFQSLEKSNLANLIPLLVCLSVAPLSMVFGYLTPLLVSEIAQDDPKKVGNAYAMNIAGCVLGPLFAGYVMLPFIGTRHSLIILAVVLSLLAIRTANQAALLGSFIMVMTAFFFTSWEEGGSYAWASDVVMHRDYAATTLALNNHGCKWLFVNGQGMTSLSSICKWMSHLPLGIHPGKSKSVLVICFGMGTSFRSALTWGGKVTVVELVPGVRDSFSYYHSDANAIIKNPNARIVIDDGRRFLRRTNEKFDIILLDPPPPQESAGSSLLYTTEFYQLIKKHLNPGGILNAWSGTRDANEFLHSFMRSIKQEFPYTRVYGSMEAKTWHWGYHVLCSESPIPPMTATEFISKLPKKAKDDLSEWLPGNNHDQALQNCVKDVFSQEIPIDQLLVSNKAYIITDDHPFSEYYHLRRMTGKQVYLTF